MHEDDVKKQAREQQAQGERASYEKMIPTHPQDNVEQKRVSNRRDLGTVGGGTIPQNNAEEARSTQGDIGAPAGGATDRVQAEEQRQRGRDNISGEHDQTPPASKNTVDAQAGKSIGGRTPSQPQTSMGDRDPRASGGQGTNQDIIDPMTARTPEENKSAQRDQKDKP